MSSGCKRIRHFGQNSGGMTRQSRGPSERQESGAVSEHTRAKQACSRGVAGELPTPSPSESKAIEIESYVSRSEHSYEIEGTTLPARMM